MRLLFSTIAPPYPPTRGQRLRNWGLLRGFARLGHEIALATFASPEDERHGAALRGVCRSVEMIPFPEASLGNRYWSRFKTLWSGYPDGVRRFRSPEMTAAIEAYLRRTGADAVLCDDLYAMANMPPQLAVPLLLNKHDLLSVILRRYAAHQRNPVLAAYARLESHKAWHWELECVRRSHTTICCSPVDAAMLAEACPGSHCSVVPNAIDTDSYAPAGDVDTHNLLYTGSLEWYPNLDAVRFFLGSILPRIRRRFPRATLTVTGPRPSRQVIGSLPDGEQVEFTGLVPDIRPVIGRSAVCVVPLRIGSGTRLKILEAAAMAKAVVSTRLGAEGLDLADGREILLADEPEAFADAVCSLLAGGACRRTLGAAAQQKVLEGYGVAAVASALQRALGSRAAAAHG